MTEIDNLRQGLADIATEVDAVDLRDRALGTSRRVGRRRTAAIATAGIAAVAVVFGAATVRPDRAPVPGVSPQPSGVSPTALPNDRPDAESDLGPFRSGTITVPSWGPAADATCTKGRVTLVDGQAAAGGARRPVNVLSYVTVDVDRDGTDDYVAHLMCGEGPESGGAQVVAFRRAGQELQVLGRVVGTQDGLAMMDHLAPGVDGRVAVLVSKEWTDTGQNTVPNQWRTYAWQDHQFRQVDGPTSFPAQSPAARLTMAASPLTLRAQGTAFTGALTIRVRNAGDVSVAELQLLLILPQEVRPAGGGWNGCFTRPDPRMTALVCVVPGPKAGGETSTTLEFFAATKPVVIDDPINLGNHYVSVSQLPPFDGQVVIDFPEAVFPITM